MDQKQVLYYERGDGWIQVEGDKLYLSKGALPSKPVPAGISQGVGVTASDIWPNGRIPYVIDSNLPNQYRITDAIQHWNNNLNGVIQFVPRTNESDYAYFRKASEGCSSPVGYFAGAGAHPIDISDQCGSGNVAHEMGHIVGLDHEQNRLDRDNFITINWGKILSGYSQNFAISAYHTNYQNYDFGSIMHYTLTAFSSDGSQTIVPKVSIPANVTVGQRQSLSSGDIASVIQMYGGDPGTNNNQGLFGHYYGSTGFQDLRIEQIDTNFNFNWGNAAPATGMPVDNFSIRWKGWLQPSASGLYTLSVSGHDGYRVIIDGTTVVNQLNSTGYSQVISNPLQLWQSQQYRIIIDYVGKTGTSSFRLGWRKDGGTDAVIPAENLIPDTVSDLPSNICTGF